MTGLTASDLTIRRGGHAILDAVSLRANGGEFIAVIGANGAGKSTLLSALAGLLKLDHGHVDVNGRPISDLRPVELGRLRAYLPQNPRCEWPISVERLVALGLTPTLPPFGGLPAALQMRVDAVIESCDLAAHRSQPATTLSGGELARAMLARALVGNPQILIVDEPMDGLDPRHVLDTARRLRELVRGGTLVISAVHDLTLAARFSTRIVALHKGRLATDGEPARILTPELIRSIFDVDAAVMGAGATAFVDYLAPS